jgi:hypothetical protein
MNFIFFHLWMTALYLRLEHIARNLMVLCPLKAVYIICFHMSNVWIFIFFLQFMAINQTHISEISLVNTKYSNWMNNHLKIVYLSEIKCLAKWVENECSQHLFFCLILRIITCCTAIFPSCNETVSSYSLCVS